MIRFSMALAGLLALALGACHTPAGPDYQHVSEPVYDWRLNRDGELVVRVPSNGCTTRDSFYTDVRGSGAQGWNFDVTLVRIHPDYCRALLPRGVELVWTRDDLGLPPGAGLRVTNPRSAPREG
ncbi:hypothetical protein F1654_00400 [Alkalicaulis satelles]|uniref:Lipoprotein n=1 Tax=Alkalicaulis satelles TaxID=2609175 RepID=A0A5M6ZI43_9PROT|nr:hypothetical protein [Alkalicaulis satelles]KAA5804506.1 hypothetical protein F1654_00400 [Alkalicaulis satelles]